RERGSVRGRAGRAPGVAVVLVVDGRVIGLLLPLEAGQPVRHRPVPVVHEPGAVARRSRATRPVLEPAPHGRVGLGALPGRILVLRDVGAAVGVVLGRRLLLAARIVRGCEVSVPLAPVLRGGGGDAGGTEEQGGGEDGTGRVETQSESASHGGPEP